MRPGDLVLSLYTPFEEVTHILDEMMKWYNENDKEDIERAKTEYDRYRRRCDEEPGYEEPEWEERDSQDRMFRFIDERSKAGRVIHWFRKESNNYLWERGFHTRPYSGISGDFEDSQDFGLAHVCAQ